MLWTKEIVAVFLGGAIGSLSRFLLSRFASIWLPRNFPWGILIVNLLGCFIVGLFAGLLLNKMWLSTFWRTAIFIGFLAGFTTLSSFSLDTVNLLQQGAVSDALLNVLVTVFFGLALTIGGLYLGKVISC